ncbi:hypothetical protein [Williamsia sterculiae]|uniref:hypothetical protein n=1 Tax=Williamsia sterculiae TaxID=1344003 RepID=UPI001F325C04|nr:hypothetical protein [Williamsia sterculiae]
MKARPSQRHDQPVGWLEPTTELPSHAVMGTEAFDKIERIARETTMHANHSWLAFDADGLLVDWQDIDSDTWANNTTPQQCVHVFAGGANRHCCNVVEQQWLFLTKETPHEFVCDIQPRDRPHSARVRLADRQ